MSRRSGATTLQDVAREAGVSAMTVSVVMNGARSETRVSDSTRERIREIALRLRYRPNAVAQALSRRRLDTIGVVAEIDAKEINLYFLEVLKGILESARRHGQNTTVLSIGSWEQEEHRIVKFCDGRVDGIIFIGPILSSQFAKLVAHHVPFVAIHSNSPLEEAQNLESDDEGGAYLMVKYLIGQGHRHIAHFRGNDGLRGADLRHAGYRRALEEAGIRYRDDLVFRGRFETASGRDGARRLISRRRGSLPTAVFCANDNIAYGCMEVLGEFGLTVPQDISVVGFDDALLARMTYPPLTTIRQPVREMGHRAVDLLMPKITDQSENAVKSDSSIEVFTVELVVRGSVGSPRTGK